jgi:hypothetical protein
MPAKRRIRDIPERGPIGPPLAEGVEEVLRVKIFETMIQNSRFRRIEIAASAAHTNNSCENFDGPDFFNSLSQQRKFALLNIGGSSRPSLSLN